MENAERRLVEVFPPGEFIQEELDARGWLQTDFVEILGVNKKTVSEIISGKRSITPDMALLIGEALGTGPTVWLNLDSEYRLHKASREKHRNKSVPRKAELYAKYPVRVMAKRNWLKQTKDIDLLDQELSNFFSGPKFSYAARKQEDESKLPLQLAWLYRTRNIAEQMHVGSFTELKLARAMKELKDYRISRDCIDAIPELLREAGIRFVVNEFLPSSKIDGVCFWLDNKSPVVALSLRRDRIDNFWFTLMHELHHVKYGHAKEVALLDVGLDERDDETISEEERLADQGAVEFLVPETELDKFISRVRPAFTPLQIRGFSKRIGVHPGIVVGQLQHRKLVEFSHHRKMLEPIRELVASSTMCDGWGAVL